jgi:hypothetical protein
LEKVESKGSKTFALPQKSNRTHSNEHMKQLVRGLRFQEFGGCMVIE